MSETERSSPLPTDVARRGVALLPGLERLLGTREAAEDVLQEALLRYVQRFELDAATITDSSAWLRRVARNLAIDRVRHDRLKRDSLDRGYLDRHADAPTGPEDELLARERRRAVLADLLDSATARDVAVVLLREVFGTDYAEIEPGSGRSAAAWRQAVHRTLERGRERHDARAGYPPRRDARAARRRAVGRDDDFGSPLRVAEVERREAIGDDTLERFDRALVERDAAPLHDALRIESTAARTELRVVPDSDRVHLVLALGALVLCRVPVARATDGSDGLLPRNGRRSMPA